MCLLAPVVDESTAHAGVSILFKVSFWPGSAGWEPSHAPEVCQFGSRPGRTWKATSRGFSLSPFLSLSMSWVSVKRSKSLVGKLVGFCFFIQFDSLCVTLLNFFWDLACPALKFFASLYKSIHCQENAANIDLEVINKCSWLDTFSDTESTSNETQLDI